MPEKIMICAQPALDLVQEPVGSVYRRGGIEIYHADALTLYKQWNSPIVILSDGAYGLNLFPGDPPAVEALKEWYEPHIKAWSERATPQTTLWFWNTELGWATVHPLLVQHGWRYVCCHIWDKGIAHVAGNSNTQVLRKFPVVTEVCAQYVREVHVKGMSLQEWLRSEWERSGLPFWSANTACGVKNAATRKYLTKDRLWYFPPPDAFERLVEYANKFGKLEGRPYFSANGICPLNGEEWSKFRAKFYCKVGVTNVWRVPPLHSKERVRIGGKGCHPNQKPLELMKIILEACSDPGDLVWEPFGGLCTAAIASYKFGRHCLSAEIQRAFYELAVGRLQNA